MKKLIHWATLICFSLAIITMLNACLYFSCNDKGEIVTRSYVADAYYWAKDLNNGAINTDVLRLDSIYNSGEGNREKILSINISDKQNYSILGYSTIPAKNCIGKNMIRLNETLSKSTTTEYMIGGNVEIEAGLATFISGAVGLQFGYTQGTTIERSFFFEVDVQPHTNSEYKIVWKEIWQQGEAVIINKSGVKQTIPFEIKSGIQYEIDSVKELECD